MTISFRTHTDALIAALEDEGLTVGRGQAPKDTSPPYAVVYAIPGGNVTGELGWESFDVELVYQVTCVGTSSQQAEWVTDKAMNLLYGFDMDDRSVALVTCDVTPSVQRDDNVTPPLFYATPRFRVKTTPKQPELSN